MFAMPATQPGEYCIIDIVGVDKQTKTDRPRQTIDIMRALVHVSCPTSRQTGSDSTSCCFPPPITNPYPRGCY